MTEEEKMLAGMLYYAPDPALMEKLSANKERIQRYNALPSTDLAARDALIREILGSTGRELFINQPFYCDYGSNIHVGEHFFANFNFTVLDEAEVRIGDNVFFGPNVGIYTACHSTDPVERNTRQEWAKPVVIGHNCWIGGSVVILAGVTIGDNCTIGAGSVVTRDIPANSVAVGNPCRVIKSI